MRERGNIYILRVPIPSIINGVEFCLEKFGRLDRNSQNNRWSWCPFKDYVEFYFADQSDAIVFKLAVSV